MKGSSAQDPLQLPDSDSDSDIDDVVLLTQPQNLPIPAAKKSKAQRQQVSASKATQRPHFPAPLVNVAKQKCTDSTKPTKPNNHQQQRERPEPDEKDIICIHDTDSEEEESEKIERHAANVPAQVASAQMHVPDMPPAADSLPDAPTVAAKSPPVAPAAEVSPNSLDTDVRPSIHAADLPPVAQAVTQPPVPAPDFFVPSLEHMNNDLPYLAIYRVEFKKVECKKPNRDSFARAYGLAPSFEQYDPLAATEAEQTDTRKSKKKRRKNGAVNGNGQKKMRPSSATTDANSSSNNNNRRSSRVHAREGGADGDSNADFPVQDDEDQESEKVPAKSKRQRSDVKETSNDGIRGDQSLQDVNIASSQCKDGNHSNDDEMETEEYKARRQRRVLRQIVPPCVQQTPQKQQASSLLSKGSPWEDVEFNADVYAYHKAKRRLEKKELVSISEDGSNHYEEPPTQSDYQFKPDSFQEISLKSKHRTGPGRETRAITRAQGPKMTMTDEREEKQIMIGPYFQCVVPPCPLANFASMSRRTPDDSLDNCFWDPVKAELAKRDGEKIDDFLNIKEPLFTHTLKMEALHLNDYKVAKAAEHLPTLLNRHEASSDELNEEETAMFMRLIIKGEGRSSTKNFHEIARAIGRPLQVILVNYYRWKGRQSDTDPVSYKVLKEQRTSKNVDECIVCEDGGELLLCDNCNNAYHWKTCLEHPLEELPPEDSNWYCDRCVRDTPARLRHLYQGGGRRLDTGSPDRSRVAPDKRRTQLLAHHLELVHHETSSHISSEKPIKGAMMQALESPDENSVGRLHDSDVSSEHRPIAVYDDKQLLEPMEDDTASSGVSSAVIWEMSTKGLSSPSGESDPKAMNARKPTSGHDSSQSVSSWSPDDASASDLTSDDEEEELETQRNRVKTKTDANPYEYTVTIPVGENGFLGLELAETNFQSILFKGYRSNNGVISPAERFNLFRDFNDKIIEINDQPCKGKNSRYMLNFLRQEIEASREVRFKVLSKVSADEYVVDAPMTEHGLLLVIAPSNLDTNTGCTFIGYRRTDNGRGPAGPAEVGDLFHDKGDQIIEINGRKCQNAPFQDVVKMLNSVKVGATVRLKVKMSMDMNALTEKNT